MHFLNASVSCDQQHELSIFVRFCLQANSWSLGLGVSMKVKSSPAQFVGSVDVMTIHPTVNTILLIYPEHRGFLCDLQRC